MRPAHKISPGQREGRRSKDGQVAENLLDVFRYVNPKTPFSFTGADGTVRGKLGGKCAKLRSINRYRDCGKLEYIGYFRLKSEKMMGRITAGKLVENRSFSALSDGRKKGRRAESAVPQALAGKGIGIKTDWLPCTLDIDIKAKKATIYSAPLSGLCYIVL